MRGSTLPLCCDRCAARLGALRLSAGDVWVAAGLSGREISRVASGQNSRRDARCETGCCGEHGGGKPTRRTCSRKGYVRRVSSLTWIIHFCINLEMFVFGFFRWWVNGGGVTCEKIACKLLTEQIVFRKAREKKNLQDGTGEWKQQWISFFDRKQSDLWEHAVLNLRKALSQVLL